MLSFGIFGALWVSPARIRGDGCTSLATEAAAAMAVIVFVFRMQRARRI
jgi:hypothetical protein